MKLQNGNESNSREKYNARRYVVYIVSRAWHSALPACWGRYGVWQVILVLICPKAGRQVYLTFGQVNFELYLPRVRQLKAYTLRPIVTGIWFWCSNRGIGCGVV